ncbi:efflux transporter outer membrane subunit [Sphingomonas jatrophae]|uniref:Outer membrane protein, multidrug efflux system n=1 Tax=Sphingomonas jatrophae TaxID=1166337 RepID=A0A1I6JTG5_9SPHN|nr:efflux transporter outer membrane subunit [Sphingomonas jatrophae]SFR82262.1 outer membrane protein, multidrug efflux system [Sphingomonas jatrophae]
MARRDVAAAALIALAGCSAAPDYRPPITAVPADYKEAAPVVPAGWAPARPQAAGGGAWWRLFDDPVLDALEARVERASPTLAAALARYEQARAQVGVEAADLAPQVSAAASAERDRLSARRPLAGSSATFNEFTVGAQLAYEVDLWGRIRNSVRAARADAQASAADLADVRLSLQAQLADAYVRLRGLDAERALLDRTVSAFARAHQLTVTRHDGGIASGLDVSRAQTLLSDARARIAEVVNRRAALEHQIAALVGEVPSSFSLAARDGLAPPPLVPPGLPSELLQRRPDVAQAERRIFAANARIGVARAAFFPTLTLGGAAGFDATSGALLSNPATFWALGPAQAVLALFDGGRRRAQVRISRAQFDEAAAEYRGTVLTAFREVEDAIAAARLLAQASVDQRAAASAAARTEALALVRYRDGASDYLEVVTAQTAALDAERSAILLQTSRLQAAVALVRALGGGFGAVAG